MSETVKKIRERLVREDVHGYSTLADARQAIYDLLRVMDDYERELSTARALIDYQENYTNPSRRSEDEQLLIDAYYASKVRRA
jgi:hypothetical protein